MKKRRAHPKPKIRCKFHPKNRPEILEVAARHTNSHLYLQMLSGNGSFTVLNSSSLGLSRKLGIKMKKGKLCALLVGRHLANKSIAMGMPEASFNRLNFKYHGLIRMMAEAARNYGLCF